MIKHFKKLYVQVLIGVALGVALGYADPIRLAGKTPSSAEDEKFLWIGRTPLDDELDMATGRFYFRLKPNDGSATLTFFRDLTLSDGGKILKLP